MEEMSVATTVALAAFAAGIVFGATANKTNFCTMGGVSDMVLMGDTNRFRAWMLAVAVALLGTQALHMLGLIDLTRAPSDGGAIYLSSTLGWPGAILGGLLFGFGMTRAGGCGNKTLVRLGAGNLKSIIVFLVMGITGYMTMRGLFGLPRLELERLNTDLSGFGLESQSMAEIAGAITGVDAETARIAVTAVIGLGLLAYCFKSAEFRGSFTDISGGVIIGLLIPVGWWITGVIGFDEFSPTQLFSFTFVAPSGDAIQYLMTFTGSTINFGIAGVFGVIAGSFVMALATKTFHIEAFSGSDDMISHLTGAVMMGVGGVLALGCTIGQGVTGMSTLALGSLIALAAIIAGAVWGMKSLEEGSVLDGLKALFTRD
ncbi:MAG: YeeE/YedE family protein [Alphaproteobacteria bacterium]|nr:YeeE/YedE family protein [Alphaproteobacteria bacterium]MBF0251751.1 YeeE/YedE family protein [Alphaproteobacteria bacterium]